MKKQLLLGAHMPIGGGIFKSIEIGESIGCTTIQLFTHSNRQWRLKPLTQEAIKQFKETQKTSSITITVAHASYLLNIGSANKAMRNTSTKTLFDELERCDELGIPYLVLHPGAYTSSTIEDCLKHIIEQINDIFEKRSGKTMLLLENTAGQGTLVGSKFEELAYIRRGVYKKSRLGFCFDTCHAFAAGYDFSTEKKYEDMWKDFDDIIGLENLHVFHINDSKKELNSHVDRHELIGKGHIGLEAFRLIFNDPRFYDVPKILETPKLSIKEDIKNMEVLKSLLSAKTKKLLNVKD